MPVAIITFIICIVILIVIICVIGYRCKSTRGGGGIAIKRLRENTENDYANENKTRRRISKRSSKIRLQCAKRIVKRIWCSKANKPATVNVGNRIGGVDESVSNSSPRYLQFASSCDDSGNRVQTMEIKNVGWGVPRRASQTPLDIELASTTSDDCVSSYRPDTNPWRKFIDTKHDVDPKNNSADTGPSAASAIVVVKSKIKSKIQNQNQNVG